MKTGWQTKKLGDVCSLLNRGISPAYLEEGGVCVLNQKCVRDHEVSYEPSRRHDSKAKKVAEERFIQLGDVLVNSTGTGTLGRVAQVRNEPEEATTVDSHVSIVRPKPGLFHLDFFGYMLVVIEDAIKEAGEGCGGQTELARSVLAERFSVSYPESLAEQQRIVGLLDEAFEGLATARANAEKNLQNARALFESHLQSVFTQRGPGWVEKPLGEVADLLDCLHKTPTYAETGFPMVRVTDIKPGLLDLSKTRKVDEQTFIAFSKGRTPRAGDIVFSRVGSCGVSALVSSDEPFCLGQNTVFILPKINSMLLYHFLNSPNAKEQFKEFIDGTTQPTISMKSIRQVAVPIAPPAEHSRLVASLDSMREETQRLFRLYERKIVALEALKKSLLHQAFSGEL